VLKQYFSKKVEQLSAQVAAAERRLASGATEHEELLNLSLKERDERAAAELRAAKLARRCGDVEVFHPPPVGCRSDGAGGDCGDEGGVRVANERVNRTSLRAVGGAGEG
jgi:hypothetical protein